MAILLRTDKGSKLSYIEADENFSSLFYSASIDGNTLYLYYTGSQYAPQNNPVAIDIPQGSSLWTQSNDGSISRNSAVNILGNTRIIGAVTGSTLKIVSLPIGTTETKILVADTFGNIRYRSDLQLQGPAGAQGATGIGTQGATGTQGIQGPAGEQGIQGFTGEAGLVGTQGATGETGAQGTTGQTGNQGITGIQGAIGTQGVQGIQGIQGVQGTQGTQGIQGPQGTQGIQGISVQGVQGIQGIQGISVQGIQGPQGTTGIQGTQGIQGTTGDTGIGFTIAKIYSSVAALEADTTPTGISPGQFALIDTGDVENEENSYIYLWNGTVYLFVNDLSGAAGIQGIQGIQGVQGLQGIQGIQGVQGIQGISVQGLQGIQGNQGTQGIQGTQGPQGTQGTQGPQGTQGIQGIQGVQGIQGTQGTTYLQGTGISLAGGSITNTAPDQVVGLQGTGGTTVTGTYPNFTINSTTTDSTKLPLAGGTMTGAITFAAGQTWPTFNQSTTGNAATATQVYQNNQPPGGTYRLILGNETDANGTVYNFDALYYNSTNSIIYGANISGNAVTVSGITGNTGLLRDRLAASAYIDGVTTSNFRTTLFGASTSGYQISTSRWNTTPGLLSGLNGYGTMFAWAGADTHSFIAIDYSTAAVKVGGGNADLINWSKTLAFGDGTGASGTWGINITGAAATATSASSVAWSGISAGFRENYNLQFRPSDNSSSYAGISFASPGNDANAGYMLIRGGADNDIYTQNGITLVADLGWLTLAQRTTAGKGVRIMTGTSSSTRLEVTTAGATNVYGTLTASGDVVAYSDERVKENINTIENALDKVKALRGVTYSRIDNEDKSEKIGVIAQEIQEVLPQVVHEQEDGMLGVSYGNIVAVLIEAIKEQQKQIDELMRR